MFSALPTGANLRRPTVFKQHLIHLNISQYGQIRAFQHRAQKRLGSIPAHTGSLVDLKVSTALIVATVEVADAGNPALCGGIAKCIQNWPGITLLLNPPLAITAMQIGVAGKVFLTAFEQGQNFFPGPARITQLGPAVVIARLATHINHAVDRRAAAQHLAPRVAQAAALQANLGLGFEAPVGARVTDAIQVTHGDMDPRVVILPTRFEQQHAVPWIGRQPICQHGTRRSCAHNDVVVHLTG